MAPKKKKKNEYPKATISNCKHSSVDSSVNHNNHLTKSAHNTRLDSRSRNDIESFISVDFFHFRKRKWDDNGMKKKTQHQREMEKRNEKMRRKPIKVKFIHSGKSRFIMNPIPIMGIVSLLHHVKQNKNDYATQHKPLNRKKPKKGARKNERGDLRNMNMR